MTEDEWNALVRRLEVDARQNPRGYRRRILLLGSLGYLVIGTALAIVAALAFAGVWLVVTGHPLVIKLIWPVAVIGYILIRALSVRIDPPAGLTVSPAEVPALFAMIEDVVARVRGPRIHQVLLNGDLNAGVSQVPRRFGVFGWTNYMVLGVPYMQALDADEYRAVVAHEVGHLSRTHGRLGTWVYRIQSTWQQLLNALEERGSLVGGLFKGFFQWYAPYFAAYSFPLRRQHEYEADEAAAEAAGGRPAATALLHAFLASSYLERKYWPAVFERMKDEPRPPESVYPALEAALASSASYSGATALLRAHLDSEPEAHDTHPTVRQRIEHLGFDVDELASEAAANGRASKPSAARLYLGDAEPRILTQLDAVWRQEVAPGWDEMHHRAQADRQRLAELDAKAAGDQSPEEKVERAQLVALFRSEQEAIPIWRELIAEQEDNSFLRFALGRALLTEGDEAGLAELDRAMELDPGSVPNSARVAWEYLADHGRSEEAHSYRVRAVEVISELEAAQVERAEFLAEPPFVDATLSDEAVAKLRIGLEKVPNLRLAYLVRKRMKHLDDEYPVHLLFVDRDPRGFGEDRQKLVEDVVGGVEFEGWVFCPPVETLETLGLENIEGAKIYER